MRLEQLRLRTSRKDVGVVDVFGRGFVLDLSVGLVRDQCAVGDRVDVDFLGDSVAFEMERLELA